MNELIIIIIYLASINIIAFILMAVDKHKAKKQKFRIRERTLWVVAVLGGAVGAVIGMKQFRHKTKHRSFVWGMPLLVITQIILAVYLFF
ncbi:DUF1294 domain-containing protein [Virgibacillus doumboii]|uniref:DUF1294 domain-containing protein n=1 Tax=Virgibacillus doumboii TaxID=2697503 RepID=UPI002483B5F1|nr:DUF1294 domain-containing protein [Virgibacillus doumboii]